MTLTIHIRRGADGLFIGTVDEIPGLAYRGSVAGEVRERLRVLESALQSPHVRLIGLDEDGNGVILALDRRFALEARDENRLFPPRRSPFSLEEAAELLS